MAVYRWSTPHEWLKDKLGHYADQDEMNEIHAIALELLGLLDADQIQDHFQALMQDDGYFDSTDAEECPTCGQLVEPKHMADPEQHVSIDRERICLDCHRDWLQYDDVQCPACHTREESHEDHESAGEAEHRP